MAKQSSWHIGALLAAGRSSRDWSLNDLAAMTGLEARVLRALESGEQAAAAEQIAVINSAFSVPRRSAGSSSRDLWVSGGRQLSGSIDVLPSKNASVALICAALLNNGRTVLRRIARIDEVHRMVSVLRSIGVDAEWSGDDLMIDVPPGELNLLEIDVESASRTRSILLMLGPLVHRHSAFNLPYAGGCHLGKRSVEPHLAALRHFGVGVEFGDDSYLVSRNTSDGSSSRTIVLTERGDTVTENAVMVAAATPGTTIIRNASPNYMVEDLCTFLVDLGVDISGIGTTTLEIVGSDDIERDVVYQISEDPIEAMSLLTAAIVTDSEVTIRRVPIAFLEIEIELIREMGGSVTVGPEYPAANGVTRLCDLTVRPQPLRALTGSVHPLPFPGLNIDNVPFFAAIAAHAEGTTLIHDWVYENRAIYLADLQRLGVSVSLLDQHRLLVSGPTEWRAAEVVCPPALRPAVVMLIGMLASPGMSTLRNVDVINRGHFSLTERLRAIGARIEESGT